jgi:hypothetical protein
LLRFIIRVQGAKRAVILDDSRYINEIIAACKSLNIPVLGYMHGLFNKYHAGLMAYGINNKPKHTFDLYGVWSDYFRQRLLKGDLYNNSNVFVCGPIRPPKTDDLEKVRRSRRIDPIPIRVLLISEPRAMQEEVGCYVKKLLDDGRFEIVVKIRPGEKVPHFNLKKCGKLTVLETGTVYEALESVDVVAGTYGTILYEAILALIPAVIFKTSFSYGHELAEDGCAAFVNEPAMAAEIVLNAVKISEGERVRRKNAVWGENILDGAKELFDKAEKDLWKPF